MLELLILIGLFWFFWATAEALCPLATRLVRRLGQWLLRATWSQPVRKFGMAVTLWIWIVVSAGLMTLAALSALASGKGASSWLCPAVLWLMAVAWWYVMRWQARRRYAPRRLPGRRERRREP